MDEAIHTLIVWAGDFGLYSAVVGFAVMLLMPDKMGHRLGSVLAVAGGIAMGYEVVLSHTI